MPVLPRFDEMVKARGSRSVGPVAPSPAVVVTTGAPPVTSRGAPLPVTCHGGSFLWVKARGAPPGASSRGPPVTCQNKLKW